MCLRLVALSPSLLADRTSGGEVARSADCLCRGIHISTPSSAAIMAFSVEL